MTAIKRCCALALAVLMILTALPVTAFAETAAHETNASLHETTLDGIANDITRQVLRSSQKDGERIQMENTAKLDDSDEVEIIVVVNDSVADPDSQAQVNALLRTQKSALAQINRAIDGQVEPQRQYTTLLNGFSATVTYGQYKAIRKLDCVQSAFISPTFELLPDTANSNRMIGGGIYNTTGFTGEGMLVAILDTGVDMSHEIFKTAPKSPSLTKEKLQSMLETYDFQVESIVKGISVSDLYYSAKIPFQFDYGDRDKDGMPGDKGSHGTHVASTAAGNTGVNEAAMGVAPQAQIINMNVFKSTGGASYADILAALEDCILLGVDVANLSLAPTAATSTMTARTPSPRACWTCSSAPARAACPWLWPRATPITPPMATPSAARPWPPTPITAWSASPPPMASPCPWPPCPTAWSRAPMSPWAARTWPIRTAPPSARTRTPSPSAACPPGAPSSMWWFPTTARRRTMRAWT